MIDLAEWLTFEPLINLILRIVCFPLIAESYCLTHISTGNLSHLSARSERKILQVVGDLTPVGGYFRDCTVSASLLDALEIIEIFWCIEIFNIGR